jgi:hypothetical protein
MQKDIKEEPTDQLLKIGPNIIGREHNFMYISGTEVMCRKCPLGYVVGPGTELRGGHIYLEDELVI